jgi:hypothetical protein
MTVQARRFFRTGRGGFLEMIAAATGQESPELAAANNESPPRASLSGRLEFSARALESESPDGWAVALSAAGRSARLRGLPPLINPLGLLEPPRSVEPRVVDLAGRDLERLASTGVFALEGEPGTYKLTFRLEAPEGQTIAFRVEDGDERPLGWMVVGQAMPAATFPVDIPKSGPRSMMVQVKRLDPESGEVLPWSGGEGIARAWCSYQGPGLWAVDAADDDSASPALIERWAKPLGGGELSMSLRWEIAGDADEILRVDFEWNRYGAKPFPPLALGSAGHGSAETLRPEDLQAPAVQQALGGDAAAGLRLTPRQIPGRQTGNAAMLWLADRPFAFTLPEGGNPAGATLKPEPVQTRFALVKEEG